MATFGFMIWPVLTVFRAITQTAPPVPREASNSSAGGRGEVAQPTKNNEAPSAQSSSVVNPVATNPNQGPTNPPKPETTEQTVTISKLPTVSVRRDWADWVLWGFSGLLVVAGFLGIRVAYKTLEKIAEQTEATKDAAKAAADSVIAMKEQTEVTAKSAEAALLNAQAAINSERPWIVVSPRWLTNVPGSFVLVAKNRGRTPAKFISGDSNFTFHIGAAQLPSPPVYNRPFNYPYENFLEQGGEFDILPPIRPEAIFNSLTIADQMAIQGHQLFFFGRIVYEDVLGTNRPDSALHETRWCFAFIDGQFIRSGSEEYDKYT